MVLRTGNKDSIFNSLDKMRHKIRAHLREKSAYSKTLTFPNFQLASR